MCTTIRDKNERCVLCGPRRDRLLGNCVVTSSATTGKLCFLCCLVRAKELYESRIPRLAAVGVQKSKGSCRMRTRMKRVLGSKGTRVQMKVDCELL
jgi:hypothetical protein